MSEYAEAAVGSAWKDLTRLENEREELPEDVEETLIASARQSLEEAGRAFATESCAGCGGSGDRGGFLRWLAGSLLDLLFWFVLGVGIAALLIIGEERLVELGRRLLRP